MSESGHAGCGLFLFKTGSQVAQDDLELLFLQPPLESPGLPSTRIKGVHHHTWFVWSWDRTQNLMRAGQILY